MATYKPLFMYVAPASIPQIVGHIQKYLEENPIISDPEAIAEAIQKYIQEHPEIIAVASVNGKTGNVVLTGNDININAATEVTIATQIANLAAMIADTGGDIDKINDNIEDIYTELDGAEGIKARLTAVETDINDSTNGIKVRLSGIEGEVNGAGGIDSRLTTVENDMNTAQTGIKARMTDVETDVSSLKTRMTQAETDIDSNASSIGVLNESLQLTNENVASIQNENTIKAGYTFTLAQRISAGGFVTGSSQYVWFTVFTGKKITATTATVLACTATMRGVGGYLEAQQPTNLLGDGYAIDCLISNADCGILTFRINKTSALTNATNNTPIAFEVFTLSVSFS